MTDLNLRSASTDDLPALLVMEQAIIEAERPFDRSLKAQDAFYYDLPLLIDDTDSNLIVAESEQTIIGSGYAQLRESITAVSHDRHCYLGFIYVNETHRGRGVAQRIVDTLVQWGRDKGVRFFRLDVYAANAPAIRAYEKFGFSKRSVNMELEL